MELQKAIKERKSIRDFNPLKKPDYREIIEAIDTIRYAPMAGNIFSLRAILVDKKETIQKLKAASGQDFIGQTEYVVVFCTSPELTEASYKERSQKFLTQQAGAAIENFLLSIEEKGLSTCWVGYFAEDMVKEILGIPQNITVEGIFPIGYNSVKKYTRKARTEFDQIMYFNKYKKKRM